MYVDAYDAGNGTSTEISTSWQRPHQYSIAVTKHLKNQLLNTSVEFLRHKISRAEETCVDTNSEMV